MIAAGPDGEPKPEVDPAYRPSQIDGVNVEGVDVEGYVNPTVSRTKRKTQAVIIPEREDEEADDSNFVFFVPPKHEAVSYSVEAVLDSKQVGRKVLYLVKWEGFDDEADNTWEPEKNLDDCPEKLERYWKAAPDSCGAKRHGEEMEKERTKRRRLSAAKGETPPPPYSAVEAALKSMSKDKLLEAISSAWDSDGDMRSKLAEEANVRPAEDKPEEDIWQEAEDQELMLSWNWRVSIASSKPPLSKAEAGKYKIDISDGTLKIGTGGAKEVLLPEPMAIAKVYSVGDGGNAKPTDAAFPLEVGREEKGLQFDLEKEAWRMTFERAKPNAMRLRIEVFPKNSSTAKQVIFAFPDPKGV